MSMKPHEQLQKNREEILDWIEQFQKNKTEEIQTKLVMYYQPLVISLARKFAKGQDYEEDFIQIGMLGLLSALNRFDPSIGKSFESFAIPTIVGEIKRFIRDKTWSVHVPRKIKDLSPKINKAVDQLTTKLQRSPKIDEIAEYIEVTTEEVLEAMEMGRSYQALSVDHSIEADQEGGVVTLLDILGEDDEAFEKKDQQLLLEKAFSVLTERERQIIISIYFQNYSQKETGEKIGISQMHVSRLQRRALEKLRKSISIEQIET